MTRKLKMRTKTKLNLTEEQRALRKKEQMRKVYEKQKLLKKRLVANLTSVQLEKKRNRDRVKRLTETQLVSKRKRDIKYKEKIKAKRRRFMFGALENKKDSFDKMINKTLSATDRKENLHAKDMAYGGTSEVITFKNHASNNRINNENSHPIRNTETKAKQESTNYASKNLPNDESYEINFTDKNLCMTNDNHHQTKTIKQAESKNCLKRDLEHKESPLIGVDRIDDKVVEIENVTEKTVDRVSECNDRHYYYGHCDDQGNIEIVSISDVGEYDEIILPDTTGENVKVGAPDCEKGAESKFIMKFEAEEPAVEPELMVCSANGNNNKLIEKIEGVDPLHLEGNINDIRVSDKSKIIGDCKKNGDDDDDDDDDDVQVVEIRSSPICLDSDDNSNVSSITAQTNSRAAVTSVTTKTSKRNPACRYLKKKCKPRRSGFSSFPVNQSCIIDTIDLLDSSDENEPGSTNRTVTSTLKKRRLLPKTIHQANHLKLTDTQLRNSLSKINNTFEKHSSVSNTGQTQSFISTPQSNFLNAVNLQPSNVANPPAFSAKIFNKNVIIPNAFYGNPPEIRGQSYQKTKSKSRTTGITQLQIPVPKSRRASTLKDQTCYQWLENFLVNFASPVQVASHTCFVLLQRVLKYKFLQKIREARTNLNTLAQSCRFLSQDNTPSTGMDVQLMLDLRNVFFKADSQLTDVGLRFCEAASNYIDGKIVPLTTDIKTGRVTSHTRNEKANGLMTSNMITPLSKSANWTLKSNALCQTTGCSKRKQHTEDLDEYTPSRTLSIALGEGAENAIGLEERKRSLRTTRTKRYDNNFSYNEDQDDESEEDENQREAAIARIVEQKRQEAKLKSEQMAKSFENAFIATFAKNLVVPVRSRRPSPTEIPDKNPKSALMSSDLLEIDLTCGEYPLRNCAFTYSDDTDTNGMDDDGPREHRIYKVTPIAPYVADSKIQNESTNSSTISTYPFAESPIRVIDSDESGDDNTEQVGEMTQPKNVDKSLHMKSKNQDLCVICRNRYHRIVHHYVNDHRGCEVYTSRLSNMQLASLRRNSMKEVAKAHFYINGQNQYEATCVFCQKRCSFMLSYWHQHFTMHTGEYAYRCGSCGVRKPIRSLLAAHLKSCHRQGGATVMQDFIFDSKSTKIEARVCNLCNYVQLHRSNLVHHLRSQHGLREILPKYIRSVVLLNISSSDVAAAALAKTARNAFSMNEESDPPASDVSGFIGRENDDSIDYGMDSTTGDSGLQFNYDDGDPSDDLSFMICGMLDVQVNAE